MGRVWLDLFTLCEIHLANGLAGSASAWLNHWTIRRFPYLDGFLIRGPAHSLPMDEVFGTWH